MELIRLSLISINNVKNKVYFYSPIIKVDNKYFWCKSIKSNNIVKLKDIVLKDLEVKREIPEQFYEQNGIKI